MLSKINLSEDQSRKIGYLSKNTIYQIQYATEKVKQDVEMYLRGVPMKLDLPRSEDEQLQKANGELDRSTGRVVQLYGQWIKSNRIEKDSDFK